VRTERLTQLLAQRKRDNVCRVRRVSHAGILNFSSNDYLSLSEDVRIKNAYQKGFAQYPCGSGGSMMVSGYHPIHRALEKNVAEALSVDDCLLFSSGYAANMAVVALLARIDMRLLIDKAIHASVYDGIALSHAAYERFTHHDLHDLKRKITASTGDRVILTESVFSMSGQQTVLQGIAALCAAHDVSAVVDEAHAFGVYGAQGLGLVHQQQLTQDTVPLRIIPFGKALVSTGALVAGKQEWIDALVQVARPAIYSTAISPAHAYGILKTFDIVRDENNRRVVLMALIQQFREHVRQSPLTWRDSPTAIQQLQLGCPAQAIKVSEQLREAGIYCMAIRQPTVSKKETGLRIILNYQHQAHDIAFLFNKLHTLCA